MKELLLIAVGSALCKQRCTEPVPWNLSIPWSIKKCKNSSRYGGAVVFVITISSFVTG